MQITFDEKKKLDTNPIFHLFVQGENMAESIRIVGPKMVGALDLSQLRMAVRVTSAAYETMVEKTLEQTVSDEGTITLVWNVDRQFTSNPGHVQVMLVGYGNNEEVIKITSSGIEVKEDETFISAPQGNTWEQILREMQELATQASASQTAAAASADRAAASEQVAISKAAEIEDAAEQTLANAQAAAQSAAEAAASAASIDTSAFATAAQGAKADTAVQSVNGKTGTAVSLTAADVGAAENSTPIVTAFGQLGVSKGGTFELYGKLLAVGLPGGIWRVDITGKVETSSLSTGNFGLSLNAINSALSKNLSFLDALQTKFYAYPPPGGSLGANVFGYSGIMKSVSISGDTLISPARVYSTDGQTGGWTASDTRNLDVVGTYWDATVYFTE